MTDSLTYVQTSFFADLYIEASYRKQAVLYITPTIPGRVTVQPTVSFLFDKRVSYVAYFTTSSSMQFYYFCFLNYGIVNNIIGTIQQTKSLLYEIS
jgi:hypothetical protein